MKKRVFLFSRAVQPLLLIGFTATIAFAQTSSSGTVQRVATKIIAIGKWIGIIIAVICGLTLAGGGQHGSHMGSKLTGLVVGLVLAFFAIPIVNWIQSSLSYVHAQVHGSVAQ